MLRALKRGRLFTGVRIPRTPVKPAPSRRRCFMAPAPIRIFPTTIRSMRTQAARNDNAWPLAARGAFETCLFQGDVLEILGQLAAAHPAGIFDMVFADPPYRLSNGGMTCRSGRPAPVDKGVWD